MRHQNRTMATFTVRIIIVEIKNPSQCKGSGIRFQTLALLHTR